MTAIGTVIHDEAHLRVVPDGTVVSWYRIPGDRTSEAVAFVRREVDYYDDGTRRVDVWLSPGGWEPMTVEQAGITYPAHVVRWGEVSIDAYTAPEMPVAFETLASGGTYPRDHALECAARMYSGLGAVRYVPEAIEAVLQVADAFVEWLNRDPDGLTRQPVDLAALLLLGTDDDEDTTCDGGVCPAPTDAALAAYGAWHDRDRAADGDPTAILNAAEESDDRDD